MRAVTALRRTTQTARAAALLSLGALALHQLRYLLAYGDDASGALAQQGHTYLSGIAAPLIGAALSMIAAVSLGRVLLRLPGRSRDEASLERGALLYAAALLAIFWAQELSEGLLASAHPAGLAALFAGGGWIAVPLALLLGALCSLFALGIDRAERALAAPASPRLTRLEAPLLSEASHAAPRAPLASLALAFGLARRPPPFFPIS
jgi:hypothetical protein